MDHFYFFFTVSYIFKCFKVDIYQLYNQYKSNIFSKFKIFLKSQLTQIQVSIRWQKKKEGISKH